MIEIVLAGKPMGKERVKRGQAGNAYKPERTVTFESRLAFEAQHVMAGRPLLTGALVIDLVILMPIPASASKKVRADVLAGRLYPTKKPDFDNYTKMIDAFNLIVWEDDAQIIRGDILKLYSARPLFAVRIAPAPPYMLVPEWVTSRFDEETFAPEAAASRDEGIFA